MIPPSNAQLLYMGFDCQMNLKTSETRQQLNNVSSRVDSLALPIDKIDNETDESEQKAESRETAHCQIQWPRDFLNLMKRLPFIEWSRTTFVII
jgi:hypothetical protein